MKIIKGRGAPTLRTPGNEGDLYVDQLTGKVYKCSDTKTKGKDLGFVTVYSQHVHDTEYIWEEASGTEPKTYILIDEDGNEYPAVVVDKEVVFTATDNDVRAGVTYASSEGVSVGTKVIPTYYTTAGYAVITSGSEFKITDLGDLCDFTELQAIICPFNKSIADSVAAEKVAIHDGVYAANSSEVIATVTPDKGTINLGITNDTDSIYILRYFTYKEVA